MTMCGASSGCVASNISDLLSVTKARRTSCHEVSTTTNVSVYRDAHIYIGCLTSVVIDVFSRKALPAWLFTSKRVEWYIGRRSNMLVIARKPFISSVKFM